MAVSHCWGDRVAFSNSIFIVIIVIQKSGAGLSPRFRTRLCIEGRVYSGKVASKKVAYL
jgi:hypothetical protein